MFVPGQRLLNELYNERIGLWFIRADNETSSSIVVKLSTPVLKAIFRGIPIKLFVARVTVQQQIIPLVGIEVDDDAEHPLFAHQPFINTVNMPDQPDRFFEILKDGRTRLHFLDERNLSVISSVCSLDRQQADKALEFLKLFKAEDFVWSQLADLAQDLFLRDLNRVFQNELPEHSEICLIRASLIHDELGGIIEVHDAEAVVEEYRLGDMGEGPAQELLVYNTMARVFGRSTFWSPTIDEGSSRRELTDVVGFGKGQVCLVESKALSILNVDLSRPTERKTSLIQRDIRKGLKQLKGAFRNLKTGSPIVDKKGAAIEIPLTPDTIVHGIVLVSDMFPFGDWEQVALDIRRYSSVREQLLLHVMDLADLQRASLLMPEPLAFCLYLMDRFNVVLQHNTALVRPRFVRGEDIKSLLENKNRHQ